MKAELLVIVNHHVTVKRTLVLYTPPVTAREFVCLKWDEFNIGFILGGSLMYVEWIIGTKS